MPSNPDLGTAPYFYREIISHLPLDQHVHITCVEHWDGNLYIGTSAGELLHYVSLPAADDTPTTQSPTFILASRTEPESSARNGSLQPEVRQILLLPVVNKACVLCGTTLTFYSLPELTPAFGGKIKQTDCNWVGGLDRNIDFEDHDPANGIVIIICLGQRLRLIRIGDQARKVRDIELPGCLHVRRRGDLACVADSDKYALIDVANQQKIDLFPISSSATNLESYRQPIQSPVRPLSASRSSSGSLSTSYPPGLFGADVHGHERIASLGAHSPRKSSARRSNSPFTYPERTSSRTRLDHGSPPSSLDHHFEDKPLPDVPLAQPAASVAPIPADTEEQAISAPASTQENLKRRLQPHIEAVSAGEFLLTTGTTLNEPGVGMFVNHDGDVVRGTIEFPTYPDSLVIDRALARSQAPASPGVESQADRVMAVVRRTEGGEPCVQVQGWSLDPAEQEKSKEWLPVPSDITPDMHGIIKLRTAVTSTAVFVREIPSLLGLRRVLVDDTSQTVDDTDREREEDAMFERLASAQATTILHAHDSVWWIVPCPTVVRLNARLDAATTQGQGSDPPEIATERVQTIFNNLRGQEAFDEVDFHTLGFIRQKAALLLLIDLIIGQPHDERSKRSVQDALITSDIEPRVVLSLIPDLREEVAVGSAGIWIPAGLRDTHNLAMTSIAAATNRASTATGIMDVLKHFLLAWRRKKGFGSIADEHHVFDTVDAALLHLLLDLDKKSSSGPATAGSVRAELNEVVDRGFDCFDRAVELLQRYRRLYVLSRLYQSRKMVAEVLSTWQQIIEGATDDGGELVDGELDVRKYLTKIKDPRLVEEYGAWLARRRPSLGVQVFADETSRVKFSSEDALGILNAKAPNAVKNYLEHLVFDKHMPEHVKTLITFYVDTVLAELDTSEAARSYLTESYQTYRALTSPKPTYQNFMMENAISAEWFRNRLSLLALIGGSHAASQYDIDALCQRLEPYSSILVPEMIILNGRRGHTTEALRLLTTGLGDYDTAIRYCLYGGAHIFTSKTSKYSSLDVPAPSREQQEKAFRSLLIDGYLAIPDPDECLERTAELLDRFGAWYDIDAVLSLVPNTWPLHALAGFVGNALRRLLVERRETEVVKALCGAQNLKHSVALIEKTESLGFSTVNEDHGVDSAYHSMASH